LFPTLLLLLTQTDHKTGGRSAVVPATSTKQQVKGVLLIWMMLCGFALVDSAIGLIWLSRMLNGVGSSRTLSIGLGLCERLLGWSAISLYAFRFLRREKLAVFIVCYALLGFTAGLIVFAARGALFTWFIVAQQRAVIFNFFTLGQWLGLCATGVVICTSAGLVIRAMYGRWSNSGSQAAPPRQ
jgi:hypothetical protein